MTGSSDDEQDEEDEDENDTRILQANCPQCRDHAVFLIHSKERGFKPPKFIDLLRQPQPEDILKCPVTRCSKLFVSMTPSEAVLHVLYDCAFITYPCPFRHSPNASDTSYSIDVHQIQCEVEYLFSRKPITSGYGHKDGLGFLASLLDRHLKNACVAQVICSTCGNRFSFPKFLKHRLKSCAISQMLLRARKQRRFLSLYSEAVGAFDKKFCRIASDIESSLSKHSKHSSEGTTPITSRKTNKF